MVGLVGGVQKPKWIYYLQARIARNKNFIGMITGPTGSGKSYTGLSICRMADPDFNEDRVVFRASELMKLINSKKLKKGSAILFDEAGIDLDSTQWQSLIVRMMKFLFQTFRSRNYIVIMTVPIKTFVAKGSRVLSHATFRMAGIDYDNQMTIVKPMINQYNDEIDKLYSKYLLVWTEEGAQQIRRWAIEKPPKELIDAYETKKLKYTTDLYKDITNDIQKLEDAKKPLRNAMCLKCGIQWTPSKAKQTMVKAPHCARNHSDTVWMETEEDTKI